MILTCPACTMRYLVAEGAIGPDGRRVRCASCGHEWRQAPETGLDEELFASDPNLAMLEDELKGLDAAEPFQEEDEISFIKGGTKGDFQQDTSPELSDMAIPDSVRPEPDDPVLARLIQDREEKARKAAQASPVQSGGHGWGGYAAAGVFYLLIAGLFFVLHEPIGRIWPPANMIYKVVGLPPVLPGEGLTLSDLAAEFRDDGTLSLNGRIINLQSEERAVPSVLASIVNKDGAVLHRILIGPSVARLKPEGETTFSAVHAPVPEQAENVTFAFSWLKSEGAKPPEAEDNHKESSTPEDEALEKGQIYEKHHEKAQEH